MQNLLFTLSLPPSQCHLSNSMSKGGSRGAKFFPYKKVLSKMMGKRKRRANAIHKKKSKSSLHILQMCLDSTIQKKEKVFPASAILQSSSH